MREQYDFDPWPANQKNKVRFCPDCQNFFPIEDGHFCPGRRAPTESIQTKAAVEMAANNYKYGKVAGRISGFRDGLICGIVIGAIIGMAVHWL